MSEENQVTVTNPVKTHVKNPRRVETGRRLAKISQDARNVRNVKKQLRKSTALLMWEMGVEGR